MAPTDHFDFYDSFHERGVNRIIEHVMTKRPSLFNYGTLWVAEDPDKRLCCRATAASEVRN